MNRFIRPNRQQTNTPGSSQIDFAAAKKPVLLDPGLYRLQLERAELVGRNGNTSIALTLTDIASGQIVSTKPMWVDGPNARSGDLAEQNRAVIADLLRLAGQPLDGDPTVLLKVSPGSGSWAISASRATRTQTPSTHFVVQTGRPGRAGAP